jgi:Domain of unknown function (DUF4337)
MSGGPHLDPENRGIALFIAVLALVLALSETFASSAQTAGLSKNIEASNMWSFFQAKTQRMTTVRTAAEALEVQLPTMTDPVAKAAAQKRIADWQATAKRYDTEPETNEGRKELAARAKVAETARDTAFARYHHFEVASAAVQIAIVLASAAILTKAMILTWIAAGLGVVGIFFCAVGFFAPNLFHLFH